MKPMRGTYRDYLERHVRPFAEAFDIAASGLPPREDGMSLRDSEVGQERTEAAMWHIFEASLDLAAKRRPHVPRATLAHEHHASKAWRELSQRLEQTWIYLVNDRIHGRKTFHVSPNLAERLAYTELQVPSEFLRPPFATCMFVYDDPVTKAALAAIGGGQVHDYPISVIVAIVAGATGPVLGIHATQADCRSGHFPILVLRNLLLDPSWSIEQVLRSTWNDKDPVVEEADDEQFFGPGLRFMRIVANSLLYVASASPDISGEIRAADRMPPLHQGASSKERRNRQTFVDGFSRDGYIEIGSSIPVLESAPADGSAPGVRFMVRGHWRNQAHGPGRAERKLIRIEPFWKGPDMAEAVSRIYRMR